jgi:nucleotidyltransferase substrate binding protein (TIGR01987 family)
MKETDKIDIRWQQRFANYNKALAQFTKFMEKGELDELQEQGLIQAFEYTYELAWNLMKDYYEAQGTEDIQGSRDAIRLAFKRGLIEDGDGWMNMVRHRIASVHTYNEETAIEIVEAIRRTYFNLFLDFQQKIWSKI